jgi:hypothetical protein
MRTLTIKAFGKIAVMAQDLKSWWKVIANQPAIEISSSRAATETSNLTAVFIAIAFNMVNGHEFQNSFSATSTEWNFRSTVMSKDCQAVSFCFISRCLLDFFWIIFFPSLCCIATGNAIFRIISIAFLIVTSLAISSIGSKSAVPFGAYVQHSASMP